MVTCYMVNIHVCTSIVMITGQDDPPPPPPPRHMVLRLPVPQTAGPKTMCPPQDQCSAIDIYSTASSVLDALPLNNLALVLR